MSNEATSAAATGLPSRRLFLATGSAAAVFGDLHEAAASSADAGLIAACGSVLKVDAEYGAACALDEDHPDLDRLNEEWRVGSSRVALIPAKTLGGVKAKASVLATWLPHADIEKDRLTNSLVADIAGL
jgi:hypothetical protein